MPTLRRSGFLADWSLLDGPERASMLTAGLVGVAVWLYCWAQYGFLFGFGLGWIPAAIVAYLALALAPLVWLAATAMAAWLVWVVWSQ